MFLFLFPETMHGFRTAVHRGYRYAASAFNHARTAAVAVDRGLGKAARLYNTIAPIVAPIAREALGNQRAQATHKAITDAMAGYGNVRSKVIEAHRMGDTLARQVRKEIPSIR